jgi:nitroimidazol reductase NimA-like FMN-containing flavoprotein (pyridoxamine 5'-phosphate oxidase superfamily)
MDREARLTAVPLGYVHFDSTIYFHSAKTGHKQVTHCDQCHLIAIDIEHVTGKEAIEYVRAGR